MSESLGETNCHIGEKLLPELHGVTVSHFLAMSQEASFVELETLAVHKNAKVRALVAGRESISQELLFRLSTDSCPEVRLAVATNPNAPLASLEALSQDEDNVLRFGMIQDLDVTTDILEALLLHRSPYIRRQAFLAIERKQFELLLSQEGFVPISGALHRLGGLLVSEGLMSKADVEEAATMAKIHRMKIGAAIVQAGFLLKELVVSCLLKQSDFRALL